VSFLQRIRETLAMYSELGKIKLGSMVVITTMAGYYMAPFSSFDLKRYYRALSLSLSHSTRHTTHDTRHTTHDTRHTTHDTRHTTHDTRHTTHDTR
jgi:heme O synthase-like polyprenyltransferase